MSATDWGTTFETFAGAELDLEDVSGEGDRLSLIDGIAAERIDPSAVVGEATRPEFLEAPEIPAGSRIGIKVCRHRIAAGRSTRRGRWYIPESELERVDAVALGVYTKASGPLRAAFAILPTSRLRDVLGSWSDSSHESYQRVTRPSWALVFVPPVVDQAAADGPA